MDNVPFQYSDRLAGMYAKAGVKLVYLPPYSPDLNPMRSKRYNVDIALFNFISALDVQCKLDVNVTLLENPKILNSYLTKPRS